MELPTKKYRKGLTKKESFLLSTLARENKVIFSIDEAEEILNENPKKIMHSLIRKKWLMPLKKGMYAIVPLDIGISGADSFIVHDFIIASKLVKPYYIGFWSALNYHGLSDQIPASVFIVTDKARKPLHILNSEFIFIKLNRKKLFGFEEIEVEGEKVNISNLNKTIADCLDHPEHSGGIDEIARAIYFSHEELDFSRIREYALKMNNMTIFKRLGYILEKTKLLSKYEGIFKGIRLSSGYGYLDILASRKGKHNDRWKLVINAEICPERWFY